MKEPVPEKKDGTAPFPTESGQVNPKGAAPEENAEFAQLRGQLREALPPLAQPELRRDLWPDMLRRLEEKPVRVAWFDWALLAAAGAAMVFFPGVIPALLYHL
jgi:hypothetical protein